MFFVKIKMEDRTVTLKLQKKLVDEVDKTIREHPEYFYRHRTDFVADAMRRLLTSLSNRGGTA